MKHRKYASRVIAVSLVGILSAGLCGCRASDAIQKIVYTTDASEVDETELVMNPDPDGELDDQSTEKKADESANQSKQESSAAEGDETNTDKKAETTDPNRKGENDDPDASNESAGKNQNENSQIGVNDGDQDGNTSGDGSKQGNQDEEQDDVYDPEGSQQQIPQVDGYIAAPGGAGLIVQMLGGKGVLCASSGNFLGNRLVQQVFGDEGIADVLNLWDGDGSQPMSDKNFTILMAQKPEAVVTISGQKNFSDAQMKRLESAGVKKITIDLTRAANIVAAVEAVGQLLGDHQVGNTTSVALAAEYVKYENDLRQDVEKQEGWFSYSGYDLLKPYSESRAGAKSNISYGCYTMLVSDWDEDFSFQYTQDGKLAVNQSGGAVVKGGWTDSPFSYYMAVAGVMNVGSRYGLENSSVFIPLYKLSSSKERSNSWLDDEIEAGYGSATFNRSYYNASENVNYSESGYSTATFTAHKGSIDLIQCDKFGVGYSKYTDKPTGYRGGSSHWLLQGDYAYLGQKRYPYVIAANKEVQGKMEESKNSESGLYRVTEFGIEIDGLKKPYEGKSYAENEGTANEKDITEIAHSIKNVASLTEYDYEIEVNPSGCGDWLDGSVESVLESVWISNLYYDHYDVNKEIKEFYETFYRHSLTGDQISDILDGE